METQKFTEEQEKQFKKLQRTVLIATTLTGIKTGVILLVANAVVIAADVLYVHSEAFSFCMGVVNAICAFRIMRADLIEIQEHAREELKKIIDIKQ